MNTPSRFKIGFLSLLLTLLLNLTPAHSAVVPISLDDSKALTGEGGETSGEGDDKNQPGSTAAAASPQATGPAVAGNPLDAPKIKKPEPGPGSLGGLPEPTIISAEKTGFATAEDAVLKMYYSHPFEFKHDRVAPDTNIVEMIIQDIDDLIKGKRPETKGTDIKDILKVIEFYGLGSEKLADKIVEAAKAGMEIEIITDFNRSMEVDWKNEKEKSTGDFKRFKIKDNATGLVLKKLFEAGFVYNGTKKDRLRITSQPVGQPSEGDRIPIYHMKSTYTVIKGIVKRFLTGSANMTDEPRVNRFFDIHPILGQVAYEHEQRTYETFRKGGSIKDVPSLPPMKFMARDGSSVSIGFTDGRNQLNRIWTNLMERGLMDPNFKVEKLLFSDFVYTFTPSHEILKALLKKYPDMQLYGVFDAKFVNDVWGLPRTIIGMNRYTEFGGTDLGYPGKMQFDSQGNPRFELYAWQQGIEGHPNLDPDGPPSGVIHHTKDGMMKALVNGIIKNYIRTGSFNFSGNFHNMELGMNFADLHENSWLAKAFFESAMQVARNNPQHAIPLDIAITRDELGRFVGIDYLEIPVKTVKEILLLIRKNELEKVAQILMELASTKTKLKKIIDPTELTQRISKIRDFFQWLRAQEGGNRRANTFSLEGLIDLCKIVQADTGRKLSHGQIRTALGGMLWGIGAVDSDPKTEVAKLLPGAWKAIGMKGEFVPARAPIEIVFGVFDIDGTIFNLDSPIVLFHKKTGKEMLVPNLVYDQIKDLVGVKIPGKKNKYADYELRPEGDRLTNSFKYFGEGPKGENYLLEAIKRAVKTPEGFGPAFKPFIDMLSDPEASKRVIINTARPNVDHIMETLEWLHAEKIIPSVPLRENIIAVGDPEFRKGLSVEGAKARELLRELQEANEFTKLSEAYDLPILKFYDDNPKNTLSALIEIARALGERLFPYAGKVQIIRVGPNLEEIVNIGTSGRADRTPPDTWDSSSAEPKAPEPGSTSRPAPTWRDDARIIQGSGSSCVRLFQAAS